MSEMNLEQTPQNAEEVLMSDSTPIPNEKKSAILWAFFILGLISINLGIAGYALAMAVGDPSFSPLPNYSSQAVDWQLHKNLLEVSERLGWDVQMDHNDNPVGIRVLVTDDEGHPVVGGTGTLLAFHNTRAAEHRTVPLLENEQEPGVYYAQMPMDQEGKWQVSLDLRGPQGEQYVAERTVDWSFR